MEQPQKKEFFSRGSIRYTIFVYFTVSALVIILLTGMSLYVRLSGQLKETVRNENQVLLSQVNRSVDAYLRTIMKLSDSLYYGVIKNADLSSGTVSSELTLLYDNNKDDISNIALLSKDGRLIEAVPAARLKTGLDMTQEQWFSATLERPDNMHFTKPHVQYIFDNNEKQYRWVISLTRAVEITDGTSTEQGVLLIDITYASLKQLLDNVTLGNEGYLYMVSSDGQLIYHPKMQLIDAGLAEENLQQAAVYRDGSYREEYQGEVREITVKSVGYTGWKLIGVTPEQGFSLNNIKTNLFVAFVSAFFLFILTLINAYISNRITIPIQKLEESVGELEAGKLDARIYTGGSYEIQHLGRSIGDMAARIQKLMDDIVAEHESKRKSEFDTLQSQINPHFLYNTLDIIVWMIENEQKAEAVKIVTALARFFRISLSKGKSIITVRDELEHVRNYLMIQQMRFKNKFEYEIDADPESLNLASLKLMLQPLVENAIYHGIKYKEGKGTVLVECCRGEQEILLKVGDNGIGMTKEQLERIFEKRETDTRKNGVGVLNVHERIQLYYGREYGLKFYSEPGEGTLVEVHIPRKEDEERKEDDKET